MIDPAVLKRTDIGFNLADLFWPLMAVTQLKSHIGPRFVKPDFDGSAC
jgi:hypothetical protein